MQYMVWKNADFAESQIEKTMDALFANGQLIHLLEPSEELRLHQAIDRLARLDEVDDMLLTRLRFAYNLHFELPVELIECAKAGAGVPLGRAKNLAQLVEMLPAEGMGGAGYHIVIDDLVQDGQTAENKQTAKDIVKRMIAELFQQFVFLNLNMDIMSKSEIQKTMIKERFRKEYPNIRKNLLIAIEAMDGVLAGGMLSVQGQETAEDMKKTLQEIEKEAAKARKRPIRIAAMGTKKAGKSVIINTLLRQEYAPTSSELPTPNIIQYMPEAPNSKLWMRYKGKDLNFASADELRAYIQKEFEEAQQHTGEGSGLEDMVIHYPTEELTGFEIYDTPGPNFAGAGEEHEKIAENCIERADVCIFVMNYSAHLTMDEVDFLQKIHKFFKEKGKFYSLLIAVNRIDERYSAEVEKSVTRVVDYIRKRLGGLGYLNIVTFGTSALQSFYLEKIRQLCGQAGESRELVITKDSVKNLKKSYRKWMTQLSFIDTSLGYLEDFHGYEDPTNRELDRMSGIPQLRRYVRYIGEQKADLEIVDHVISTCEMKAKAVKNALEVTRLKELAEHDRAKIYKLKKSIHRLEKEVGRILCGLERAISRDTEGAAKNWLRENQGENEKQSCKRISDGIEALVDRMKFPKDEMDAIYAGNESAIIKKIQEETKDSIIAINQEMGEKIQHGMMAYCEDRALLFGEVMEEIQEDIKGEVEKIDRELEQEKDVQALFRAFELPQFPAGVEFPTVEVEGIDSGFDPRRLRGYAQEHRIDYEVEREAHGFFESIFSFFGKTYYEQKHKYDVAKFKKDFKEFVIEKAQQAMQEVFQKALCVQNAQMSDYIGQLYKQRMAYEEDYKKIFANYMGMLQLLLDDMEEHKEAVKRDIAAFTKMNEVTQPFFSLLDDVIYQPVKEV